MALLYRPDLQAASTTLHLTERRERQSCKMASAYKRFINKPTDVVPELMQGLSLDSARVTILNPGSRHHVAVRTSLIDKSETPKVAVISGGGSGHEPMAAGYVGKGMLSGAVAGGVFSSPSTSDIVSLLDIVASHCTGILLLPMNYAGDKLNFTDAKTQLEQMRPGFPVKLLSISDDVSLPHVTEKRGIAGSVCVLKVAGAAAEAGCALDDVEKVALDAMKRIATFGVALEPCSLPGHATDPDRLGADECKYLRIS